MHFTKATRWHSKIGNHLRNKESEDTTAQERSSSNNGKISESFYCMHPLANNSAVTMTDNSSSVILGSPLVVQTTLTEPTATEGQQGIHGRIQMEMMPLYEYLVIPSLVRRMTEDPNLLPQAAARHGQDITEFTNGILPKHPQNQVAGCHLLAYKELLETGMFYHWPGRLKIVKI